MFFLLSKLLIFLIQPLNIVIVITGLSFLLKSKIWKKRLRVAALVLLLFFTNEFIINELYLLWEEKPMPFTEISQPYDVAILLAGVTHTKQKPRDRVHFGRGADRVIHTIYLYKLGLVKKVLISGGSGRISSDGPREADIIKKAFVLYGVPDEDIVLETKSRNTYENAKFSNEIIGRQFPGMRYLVVSSAFHLPRAEACFVKAGLEVDTFSTDLYSHEREFTPDVIIIPSTGALLKWNILIKELVGMIMYKVVGYI